MMERTLKVAVLGVLALSILGGLAFAQTTIDVDLVVAELVRLLKEDALDVRQAAIVALGNIGSYAEKGVPKLIEALADWTLRELAIDAIAKIGVPAVPHLVGALDSGVGDYAVEALGRIGLPALPYLIQALDHGYSGVRVRAAAALGQIGPEAKDAIPKLVEILLKDQEECSVRIAAARALGEIKAESPDAISALITARRNTNTWCRYRNEREQLAKATLKSLSQIGQAAVPWIVDAVRDERDPSVRVDLILVLGEIEEIGEEGHDINETANWLMGIVRQYPNMRASAAKGLGSIGPKAPKALPEICETLCDLLRDTDSSVRQAAAEALVKIGQASIDCLTRSLRSPYGHVRERAAWVLGELGPSASETFPQLKELLRDGDPAVRKAAINALGNFGPLASEVVPDLIEALADGQLWTPAVEALAKIGVPAIPHLIQALDNENRGVRAGAAEALGKIGPEAKEAVQKLIEILLKDREDCSVRVAAARALEEIKSESPEVISALIAVRKTMEAVWGWQCYSDQRRELRERFLRSLARLGLIAVPQIIVALKEEKDASVKSDLAGVLEAIASPAADPGLVAEIIALISYERDSLVKASLIRALGKMGSAAKDGAELLVQIVQKGAEPSEVRVNALIALGKIAGPGGIEVLREALGERDPSIREAAAKALGEIGLKASEVVVDLCESLRDENASVRKAAAEALAKIGLASLDCLITALNHRYWYVRELAAWALGELGPAAKKAVPSLIARFNDKDLGVRKTAVEAVGKILKSFEPEKAEGVL